MELVDSAVAYNSRGIIIGTTQIVPEPTTGLLALCFAVSLPLFRKRWS